MDLSRLTLELRVEMLEQLVQGLARGLLQHEYSKDLERFNTKAMCNQLANEGDPVGALHTLAEESNQVRDLITRIYRAERDTSARRGEESQMDVTQVSEIDLNNMDACVGLHGDDVVMLMPPHRLSKQRAAVVAAWLVAVSGLSKEQFCALLDRVLDT